MRWANFLHFYQPANQQKDILEAVVSQCYRPIFRGLLSDPGARLTINVSGGLLEALDIRGFKDVIADIKSVFETGRAEFTSTACYHAFLPLLPEYEIERQIDLNNELLRHYLGDTFSPKGFFPPEMAVSKKIVDIVAKKGFEYILLDELACAEGSEGLNGTRLHQVRGTSLRVFFRQRNPSNIIMSGIERDSSNIHKLINSYGSGVYLVTAMDGETFGHHRPGLEKAFLETFKNRDIQFCRISDLTDTEYALPIVDVGIVDSTWASSRDDILKGIQFISWNDPQNAIHGWQWELVNLMLELVSKELRSLADRALASDQFFWASAKPWWSLEMIESGAYGCLTAIENSPGLSESNLKKAQGLYRSIISTAFEWQRTGKIREMNKERSMIQRIPFKSRTLEAGGAETAVYQAFIDMMKEQEKQAANKGEYEKAILWRDAVYKIETKNDIYDAISAIDLLRVEISNEKVEKVLDLYTDRYRMIRGGQPEQRSN